MHYHAVNVVATGRCMHAHKDANVQHKLIITWWLQPCQYMSPKEAGLQWLLSAW